MEDIADLTTGVSDLLRSFTFRDIPCFQQVRIIASKAMIPLMCLSGCLKRQVLEATANNLFEDFVFDTVDGRIAAGGIAVDVIPLFEHLKLLVGICLL